MTRPFGGREGEPHSAAANGGGQSRGERRAVSVAGQAGRPPCCCHPPLADVNVSRLCLVWPSELARVSAVTVASWRASLLSSLNADRSGISPMSS